MEDTYVRLVNCLHLFRSSASSFSFFCSSNHQGVVFFLFLLLSPLSSVLQRHLEEGNFFSDYNQSNWLFCVLFSPMHSRIWTLVTFSDHFFFSILLQYHIWKFSKYSRSNFLSVQVSESYKIMLQNIIPSQISPWVHEFNYTRL